MQFSSVSFRTGCSHVPKAICSALHVLRSAGYLPSDWNAVLFYCAYHYPKEIPSLHWGFRRGRGSPLLQPLPIVVFQRSLWIKTEEIFLSLLLFSFPPLPSGEAAGWSLPASHILLCLLPLFSHFLKNIVFFQVLYSYSVLAIKVPSQPFSFTLWLWPFVRLRIFRVNRSLRSPRMLFSFIHSALWMEQPGVGSCSAALHSESTQSFFFQGPFKIRPKVCRGAWRSVSHAASYISLPATAESEEQRRDESKKPTVKGKGRSLRTMPSLPVWHTLGTYVSAATEPPTNLARALTPRTRAERGPYRTPPFSRCSVGWGNTSSAICASASSYYLWQLALLFGREKAPSLHFHCKMFGNGPLGLIRQRRVCECPRGREG